MDAQRKVDNILKHYLLDLGRTHGPGSWCWLCLPFSNLHSELKRDRDTSGRHKNKWVHNGRKSTRVRKYCCAEVRVKSGGNVEFWKFGESPRFDVSHHNTSLWVFQITCGSSRSIGFVEHYSLPCHGSRLYLAVLDLDKFNIDFNAITSAVSDTTTEITRETC